MSTPTVTLFLALLAVAAELAVVAAVVLNLAARWSPAAAGWGRGGSAPIRPAAVLTLAAGGSPAAAGWRREASAAIGPSALLLAFAVALVCTLGSLYLSEVAHFVPCKLCWYQRIAMYPLVPILGLAALRQDD